MNKLIRSFTIAVAFIFGNQAESAKIAGETFDYKIGDEVFEAYIARPAIQRHQKSLRKQPAILLIHNWKGISEETKFQAHRFAKLGYTVFAADVYGKGVRPSDPQAAREQSSRFKSDRKLFRKRLRAALDQLKRDHAVDSERIAVLGYCFGGTGALELARSGAEFRAAISFHGGLDSPSPKDGKKIRAKVLVLHGSDDPHVKKSDLEAFLSEMKSNHVEHTFVAYPGAVHSFTDKSAGMDPSKGSAYNKKADEDSFRRAQKFLNSIFSSPST